MKILNSVGSVFDRFINNVRDNNNKKSEAKIADVQPNIKPAKYPSQFVPLIKEDRITDTFVRLAKMDSGSNEVMAEKQIPSTVEQKCIANWLKSDLEKLGLKDIAVDEHFFVTATLESNIEKAPVIGLLAHMDTSPDAPNKGVKPQINDYKGGDIVLKEGTTISAKDLKAYVGQKVITSDGTTLLGADDKAGIAEILETLNVLKENPDIKHPQIKVAFTPDEETGMGIKSFDIKKFGADIAYTVDGDLPQVVENESFNAFNPEINIKGNNVHCGYAKGKMINALSVGSWIQEQLPKDQLPETTEGRQGYYHVNQINGDVGQTNMKMLVRDHDYNKAVERVNFLKDIVDKAKDKFHCDIEFNPKEMYRNMGDKIKEFPELMQYTLEGVSRSQLKPETKAIRGGTDGCHLSLNGLRTPNLGAGGLNFHSKAEFLPVQNLTKCTENILNILSVWAEKASEVMPKILALRK